VFISLKVLSVSDNEKLPPDDDNEKKDSPFEEFINQNLPLDSVPKEGVTPPADDASSKKEASAGDDDPFGDDDDDDEDESNTRPSPGTFPRFPSGKSPFSSSSSPFGSLPPLSGSRLGSGSSDNKPASPFGSSRFGSPAGSGGNRFGGGGTTPPSGSGSNNPNNPFSRPSAFGRPPTTTPRIPMSWGERVWDDIKQKGTPEVIYGLIAFVVVVVVLFTAMSVDRLRLTIALREGQITELRYQVESLEARLNGAELPPTPENGESNP